MTITVSKCGVWLLDEVYQKINAGNYTFSSRLYAWGCNAYGQLGDGTVISKSSPVQIPGTWSSVTAGYGFSFGIKPDNTLWAWGCNASGQLGDGTVISKSSPVQIPGSTWCKISSGGGGRTTLGLQTDGTMWGWGFNNNAGSCLIPEGSGLTRSSPTQIPGTTWNDICMAQYNGYARRTDGTLWAWGEGTYGAVGDNTASLRNSPVQIPGTTWNDISANAAGGAGSAYARRTDGTLWAWGYNNYGQVDSTITQRSSPIQIPGTTWNEVSAGSYHALARRTDGTLWGWGYNGYGNLAQNNTVAYSSPVQIPGTTWNSIGKGEFGLNNLATKTDGTMWAWGYNLVGGLGDGTTINRSSPVQIPGSAWRFVSIAQINGLAISC
jgi:alpha-tubulin suppressor-like RCC1 family protein